MLSRFRLFQQWNNYYFLIKNQKKIKYYVYIYIKYIIISSSYLFIWKNFSFYYFKNKKRFIYTKEEKSLLFLHISNNQIRNYISLNDNFLLTKQKKQKNILLFLLTGIISFITIYNKDSFIINNQENKIIDNSINEKNYLLFKNESNIM